MAKSLYETIDDMNHNEIKQVTDDVDKDNPEIVPNCRVRIKGEKWTGKVLWINEMGIPVVLIGEAKMQIQKEGLERLK